MTAVIFMGTVTADTITTAQINNTCDLCDRGFRRVAGIHIGSQRLGMIPAVPCDRVFALCDEKAPDLARSWLAYVDGAPLHKSGEIRRYTSASTARRAARKAAPRRWHP